MALALTLGVTFFATVTAIMLVRTRARAERADAAARSEIMALKAEVDRTKALLLSQPGQPVLSSLGKDCQFLRA